jgi:hypothetical protein
LIAVLVKLTGSILNLPVDFILGCDHAGLHLPTRSSRRWIGGSL